MYADADKVGAELGALVREHFTAKIREQIAKVFKTKMPT